MKSAQNFLVMAMVAGTLAGCGSNTPASPTADDIKSASQDNYNRMLGTSRLSNPYTVQDIHDLVCDKDADHLGFVCTYKYVVLINDMKGQRTETYDAKSLRFVKDEQKSWVLCPSRGPAPAACSAK